MKTPSDMEYEAGVARKRSWKLTALGFALVALSAPLANAAYPSIVVDDSGSMKETGSAWWCWVAGILAGFGGTLLLVGIIALGVSLGRKASQAT